MAGSENSRLPRLVLLPGMDGTGALFSGLLQELPRAPEPVVISYPVDVALDLDGLVAFVEPNLPRGEPVVLLGESFSGLVATRLAARRRAGLAGLVLVASFLRYPPARALLWRALARDVLFGVTPPAALLRMLLLGTDAPDALVDATRSAIRHVDPAVLARRLRAVLAADVRADFAEARAPVMYLRGSGDRLVGGWAAEQVRVARPDVDVKVLDAPHFVLQRQPEVAAAALSAFVDRCATCTARAGVA